MAHAFALPDNADAVRVLAVDSTHMNSQLLASALERDKRFRVLEIGPDSSSIVPKVLADSPSVVVISSELDDSPRKGFAVAREIRSVSPETRIVMLLDSSDRAEVVEAFRAGARGVFCRNDSLKSLAKCIHCVYLGQVWASSAELRYVLDALTQVPPMRIIDARGAALLSRREQEVVRCVAEGLSNREIAQRLGLTEHTVKNYLFRIFDKLGVSKRVEVVLYAYSLGGNLADGHDKAGAHPGKPAGMPAKGPSGTNGSALNLG